MGAVGIIAHIVKMQLFFNEILKNVALKMFEGCH